MHLSILCESLPFERLFEQQSYTVYFFANDIDYCRLFYHKFDVKSEVLVQCLFSNDKFSFIPDMTLMYYICNIMYM